MSYRIIKKLKNANVLNYYAFVSATSIYIYPDGQMSKNFPSNLFEWDIDNHYHSQNIENQSIRIDFTASKPYLEKILIKTTRNRDPYNWKVEGSQNGSEFIELYRNENTKLCDWGLFDGFAIGCLENEEKSFELSQKDYYQSIKLMQIGFDSNNQRFLVLSAIDFEGTISIKKLTCRNLRLPNTRIVFFILFIQQ